MNNCSKVNMRQKTSKEIFVLNKFLRKSFSKFAINSCEPPKPDCLCRYSNGERVYFELSEIINQDLAKKFYDKNLQFTGGFFSDDILGKRIEDKFKKQYETDGLNVELLLFFDLQPLWAEITIIEQIKILLRSMQRTIFSKVSLFDVHKNNVLFQST
ncbi:MAG: hypothetical protein PHV77_05085 [Candidatus Omnitrophica bacterium]|nr:hypothetical protein [Candidatus Omnitrophota bacterium]